MGDQVVGGDQDPALGVPEDGVRGAVARAVLDLERAVAELAAPRRRAAAGSPRPARPRRGSCARRCAARVTTSSGMPWRSISAAANSSSRSASSPKFSTNGTTHVDRRDLGARALGDDVDQAEVVDVLVGEDDQLEVLDRVAEPASWRSSSSSALPEFGPGVDQGQRLVLDQVAVDPPDRERGRDPQAVDARVGGRAASASSASRRRSRADQRQHLVALGAPCPRGETSDSRLRRSSGSVFEGRTLKCQSA